VVGSNAGYFHGNRFGSGCWVYVYQDATGWHFLDVACGQAVGSLPTLNTDDLVYASGCGNVRAEPSLQAQVVRCLPSGTNVHLGNGLVYADGKLWWLVQNQGWMAHELLVAESARH
jgi:hypothetical protein